jgi:hypothetical protein
MGGWSTPRPGRFTPGKTSYPLYRRLGGTDGRSGRAREILPPPGFDPRIVQPVASRYTNYTLPAHRGIAVLILKLGARSGERSAAPPGLLILEENPQHPSTRGLGPHSRSRRFREQLENSTSEFVKFNTAETYKNSPAVSVLVQIRQE